MALQARLALLEQLRQDLAHNIAALGVSASATETLETLVPKVLLVLGGTEGFTASILPEWDISYGVFTTGEIVSMDGMVTVTSASRIKALSITVTGTGVSSLNDAGSGWSWSLAGDTITGSYEPGGVLTLQGIMEAFDQVTFAGDGETSVQATVTASTQGVSGQWHGVQGAAEFAYAYIMNWQLLGEVYPTYGAAAATGKSWEELKVFTKGDKDG